MSNENKVNDGGPAFPTTTYDHGAAMNGVGVSVTDAPGLTIRDYFAAKAMAGMDLTQLVFDHGNVAGAANEVASVCYALADAMLKARGAR